MYLNFGFQIEFADSGKRFVEYCGFNFELVLVTGVLVVTTSAALEVRAVWRNPTRGSADNLLNFCASKCGLIVAQAGLDSLTLQNEGQENRFPAATLIGGESR